MPVYIHKTKCNFEYHAPKSLDEALELMDRYGDSAKIAAGSTDVLPKIKDGIYQIDHYVSLKDVKELSGCSFSEEDGLKIGAMARLIDIERLPYMTEYYPALQFAIHSMATTQVRNRGTVTGNICNAVPSAETAPSLLVYDAVVRIRSLSRGERLVPITEFFTGVLKTVVQPDEIVVSIELPTPKKGSISKYYKYAIRQAIDLAMVGVAVNILMDGRVVRDVKIGLGAVAVVPKRALNAESMLVGKELTESLIEEAALIASQQDCKPISDIRASADYRREMVRLHVRDGLMLALK